MSGDDFHAGLREVDTTANPETSFSKYHMSSLGKGSSRMGTSSIARKERGRAEVTSGRPLTLNKPQSVNRPMTSVRAAGYSSQVINVTVSPYEGKSAISRSDGSTTNENIETKCQRMEEKVSLLLQQSTLAQEKGQSRQAMEMAKEAVRRERAVVKLREQHGLSDQVNMDLTFCALFNLAQQYANSNLLTEAQNMYEALLKNKALTTAGDLAVNVGNIFMERQQYVKAIRQYQIALENVPNVQKMIKHKILCNIGVAYFKLRRYSDAATNFEQALQMKADFRVGLNLLVCTVLLEDWQQLKAAFASLLDIDQDLHNESSYYADPENPTESMVITAFRSDNLYQIEKAKKQRRDKIILTAAGLVAPRIPSNFAEGYSWCVEMIKKSKYADIADDLELKSATQCLRAGDIDAAFGIFKSFEKESRSFISSMNNMAVLHALQEENKEAEDMIERAFSIDRYNAYVLVNRGNISYRRGEYEMAREFYREAWSNEASCIESLYNLALTCHNMELMDEAMECLQKLRSMCPGFPEVLIRIAEWYLAKSDFNTALDWYTQAHILVPTDPTILTKMGELHEKIGDRQQAFHFYLDSFRLYPSSLNTIEWLGTYYVEKELSEKALTYFQRAAMIQPQEIKWHLVIASCLRRTGNYTKALQQYREVHAKFPDSVQCLEQLVRVAADLGLPETAEYTAALKRAVKLKYQKEKEQQKPGSIKSLITAPRLSDKGQAISDSYTRPPSRVKPSVDSDGYDENRDTETLSSYLGNGSIPKFSTTTRKSIIDKFNWLENETVLDELLPE